MLRGASGPPPTEPGVWPRRPAIAWGVGRAVGVVGYWVVGLGALALLEYVVGPAGDNMANATSSENLYSDAINQFFQRSGAGGDAAPDSQDGKLQQLVKGTSYLGKPVSVDLPGTVSTPSTGGPPSLPSIPGMGGVAGTAQAGRAASGAGGGGGGPTLEQQIAQALGVGEKGAAFAAKLLGTDDLGTRGDVGGAGTPQDSNTSLSDVLRSGVAVPDAIGSLRTPSLFGTQIASEGGAEGLRGLGTMTPAGEAAAQLDALTKSLGLPEGSLSAIDPQQLADVLTGGTVAPISSAGSIPSAATGAASSLGSDINLGAGGAGVVAALLGLIAQETGNADMGKAAQALGGAASAAGLVGSGASLAASGATIGSEIGAEAAGLSAGAGAGLAFAPITAMMLASLISGLAGGEDPVGEGIGEMMAGTPHFQSFVPKLMAGEGQQGKALNTLQAALPYVKSQEELGQLLNSYKNYVTTTTGAPLTGGAEGLYSVQTIPGSGPVTHGVQTGAADWGPETAAIQQQIDALLGVLPGQKITAAYGQPGGGLTGEPARRLWEQFRIADALPAAFSKDGQVAIYGGPNQPATFVSEQDLATAQRAGTVGYQPAWDPATGHVYYTWAGGATPPTGSDFFAMAPYWRQLTGQAPTGAPPVGTDPLAAALLAQDPAARVPGQHTSVTGPEEQLAPDLDLQLRRALMAA